MSTQSNSPSNDTKRSPADQAVLDAIARLPTPAGPSKALDAAILAASRQAVRRPPLARLRPWLSMAAAVFVVFFAANLMQRESARESAESERISLPAETHADSESPALENADAGASAMAEEAAPVPATLPAPSEPPARAKKADQPTATTAALRSAPEPEPSSTSSRAAAKPLPQNAPEVESPRPRAFPADDAPAAPQTVAPSAPAALAPPPARERTDRRSSAGAVGATSATAQPAPASEKATAISADAVDSEEATNSEAERWFERIRASLRAGDQAQAEALLEQFRSRFPDLALPEDLRPLEESPR